MPGAERPPSCCARSPCACSWIGPARRSRASRSAIATRPTSCRSATTSTACRSRSSLPRHASGACRRVSSRARLGESFRLLRQEQRTAEPRRQTLEGALDWSYRLLDADEAALLRRLGVFAGTFDLAAVEAVCGGEDSVEVLGRLVRKSLVVAEEVEGEPRYRLLEMIRQYARERLAEAGETRAPGRAARPLVPRPAGARRSGLRRGAAAATRPGARQPARRRSAGCSSTTRPRRCASPTRSATGG